MNIFNNYYIFTNLKCGGVVPSRGKDFRIERHCFHTIGSIGSIVLVKKLNPTKGT